jgi:hypothetical protein
MKLFFKKVKDYLLNVKEDKRTEVFNWGLDNAFPSLINGLYSTSVTAKRCAAEVAKAIYGASFGDRGKVVVNSKNQTLNEVLRISAKKYSKQRNAFLQIGYDANLDIKSITVVPPKEVRVGKADDLNYSGKFVVYDNWDKLKGKIDTNKFVMYDKYHPSKTVIEDQIRASAPKEYKKNPLVDIIQYYNGQISHIKEDDSEVYSEPELMPVLSEALLEGNSQKFRSKGADRGFLNIKLLAVAPFSSEEAREEFKKDLNDLSGAEGSNDVLLLETSKPTDDVSKQIHMDDLSGTYNDQLFVYSDTQAEKNICKTHMVSVILIDTTDSSALGDSGGKMEEAQDQLWESRTEERNQFEEVFNHLGSKLAKPIEGLKIINPFIDLEEQEEARNINKKAQADLRGSVGGTDKLVDIVVKVQQNELKQDSAVSIIRNQYGYSEKKAKEMIGYKEEETEQEV